MDALQGLLNRDKVLVFYHLAEESSVLWWLAVDGLYSFRPPPRSEIEPLVQSWYTLLAEPFQDGRWLDALEARRATRLTSCSILYRILIASAWISWSTACCNAFPSARCPRPS